jgi:hypothetical protein
MRATCTPTGQAPIVVEMCVHACVWVSTCACLLLYVFVRVHVYERT